MAVCSNSNSAALMLIDAPLLEAHSLLFTAATPASDHPEEQRMIEESQKDGNQ